ncbi:MAG: enoyl-CoA hydratase/isomerase family protein [Deltaproteobacteria bacterium]|uniref:Enoyl-CoA hydratase/isomerase family protein n=1 Tax=Candidatus Zymogenus saltonus TaxID=2844893 RepID=A0A9D8PN44_9DELT|nr:enoyl-CoA hydratase/isomerase family protein [Candidatus Zymogenus saltonus]
MSGKVKVERDGEVEVISIDRPEAFNAFDHGLISDFSEALVATAKDKEVRGVVITGVGKAFCAGGDLKAILDFKGGAGAGFHALASFFHRAVLEIRRMGKPVIAAVNGIAAGGGFSLALACDFRVMERSATLRQAYSSSGLCIDGGGSFTLPRLVGLARAMEIIAFDRPISADDALEWGLATKVVEDGEALTGAVAMAKELSSISLHSFALMKRLITDSFDTPFETQIERERLALATCGEHPDGIEGMKAFVEKKRPVFNKSNK